MKNYYSKKLIVKLKKNIKLNLQTTIIGIKFIQCIMDGIGAFYNLKRLFNIIKEKEINIDDVYNFMDLLIEHRSEILSTENL